MSPFQLTVPPPLVKSEPAPKNLKPPALMFSTSPAASGCGVVTPDTKVPPLNT